MRFALLTLAAIPLCLGSALACDDHVGTCEIEDWRWYTTGHYLTVEGSATCNSGFARIRLYEETGADAQFLGVAEGLIDGHALTAIATNIDQPQSLSIKYSIDPDF